MKKYFLLLWGVIVLLNSCSSNKKEILEYKIKIDSLTNELEEVKGINEELNKKITINKREGNFYNENFNRFFKDFMIDTLFQKERIKFPLKYQTTDIETMRDTIIMIEENDWKHNSFYINTASERTQIYDNFNLRFQRTNERVLHWYGIEAGGDSKYYFKAFDNKWFLIKKYDSGI